VHGNGSDVDISGLKRRLRESLAGEVRFDAGSRAMYANDFSVYRAVPIGVVVPRSADDVIAGIAACREFGAPVLPRGCGTGPSGQTTNVAVVFDYSKYYNEILELDPEARRARVQPGVICDQLRDAAEEHNLTYGPDPATHEYCTVGGMIGNNSCGVHSLMAGMTRENVEALDILLYDGTRMTVGATTDEELERIIAAGGRRGEIYAQLRALRDRIGDRVRREFPDIPRRASGYNLEQLLPERGFNVARALVGSEGTCVNVLEATVRLVPSPQHRRTLILSYHDVFEAADHVPEILTTNPIGLEGYDDQLIRNMIAKGRLARERALLPRGGAWLYAEYGDDDPDRADELVQTAFEHLAGNPHGHQIDAKIVAAPAEQVSVWKVRESAVGDSRLPGTMDAEGAWEDAAVHPERLGAYLRDFQQLLDDHGYRCVYYGHFGEGCVHTRMDFDFKTAAGLKTFRSFMEKAADLVVSHGGSLAGEYGEGHGRAELLPRMYGPELMEAFYEFKRIWDPDWKMNPNRLIGDVKLDEGLRLGLDYRPPEVKTHFQYPDDQGSFALAVERCFGMAKCRNLGSLTMCPSFQVTREEKNSTRGRTRLLFEMLKGETITDGWRDEAVKDSLELCLSC
jgi:FAD/FMN-containing dehydrogenase